MIIASSDVTIWWWPNCVNQGRRSGKKEQTEIAEWGGWPPGCPPGGGGDHEDDEENEGDDGDQDFQRDRQWGAGWWWGQTRFEEENLKDDNDDGGEERWGWLNTWSRKILGSRSPTTWPAPFASSSSSSCLPTVFVGNGISISHQLKTDFLNFEGRNFRLPLFWFIWMLYRIIFGPNIAAFQFLKINQRIWFSVFVQEVKKLVFLETVLE